MNLPFICNNIPAVPAYGVCSVDPTFQNLRFLSGFNERGQLLTGKLPNQGFLLVKLKSLLRNIYGQHHDLFNRYGISVSQMTIDKLPLSETLSSSFLIHHKICSIVAPRVPLVEKELFILQQQLSSPLFLVGFLLLDPQFAMYCFLDCCLSFCPFSLAIVLFVTRFTDSDYLFGSSNYSYMKNITWCHSEGRQDGKYQIQR